jgi:hypothetical protein
MRVVSPRSGDVLEHGSVCVLSAEEFAPHEAVTVSIADARSWSGRWWRQIEKTRARNDGSVRVRWVVPKDLPVADAYVVRFSGAGVAAAGGAGAASGDTGRSSKSLQTGKSPSRETDVSNVKVTSPLKLTRVGRDVLEISWSPSALPTEASGRDGWRLAVDVLPVLREDEYHADVVGDLFLRAAAEGLTVHTRKKSVLYDVSKEEGARRKKNVRLPPDRTYAIALAGFTVGELEAVFSTSRADARMALVQLAALGGGYNAHNGGARRVTLGHAEFRRAPAETQTPHTQTSPNTASPSGSPGYGKELLASPGASIPTVAYSNVVADADSFPCDAAASSPSTPRLGTSPIETSLPGLEKARLSRGVSVSKTSTSNRTSRKSFGAWETSSRGVGPFGAERGVNVVVVRASDLSVAYDRTWDVSGGRRSDAARAACESLQRAFTAGELRVGSGRRQKWGAHFVALTTAGAWAMSPGKDGDDFGVAAALDAALETLGASRASRVALKDALRVPGQPAGVAVLAACGPGGAERRAWAEFGKTPKDRARVTLTLAFGAGADGGDPDPDGALDDEWFPALVRGGTGSGTVLTTSDWRAPWSSWGREPWGGVKAWAAEETRVSRYLRLVQDAHARVAFLGAAFETGSADARALFPENKNGEDASRLDDFAGPRDATSGSPGFAAVGPEPFDDGLPEDPARSRASRAKGAERVERGDGGDGSLGTAETDAGADESSKARSTTLGNRVEVYGVVKALVEYASSKFAAAKWPPSSRLREKYRTVTDEELALTRAAEALFVDIAAGGSAFAASELVNAGASEFLARRICSLLSPEGDLLGVEAGSQAASEVAAEARTLARALARVLMRNGAACLAEAARRDGAVEAVVRAFLASWRGTLGRSSVPEIEACVETFADADLRVAEVEVFAEDRGVCGAAAPGSGPRAPLGTIRAIRAGFASSRTPHLGAFGTSVREGDGTVRGRVCFLDVPAPDPKRPNAASASLPAATRRFSRGQKAPAAKKVWPPPAVSAPAARREAASSSSSLRPGDETDTDTDDAAHSAHASRREEEDEDIEPWGGSDAGSDEVMRLDEMELDDASSLARASARRLREDPNAQGGRTSAVPMDTAADTDAENTADARERDHDEDEDEDVSLAGAVAVFRGERGGWRAHEHVVRQAPRLAHLAQAAGAVAVVFLWPDRAPKYPPTQNLLPSPNFDTPLRVPAFCAPASAFAEMEHALARTRASESERTSRVAWEARLRAEPLDGEGSAACVARRCGDALVRAMSRRPSARGDAGRASRRASRGAGRVHGLHWLKRAREDRERREAKERASASSLARTSSTRDPPPRRDGTRTAGSSSSSIENRETASTAGGTANRGSTASAGESEGGWSWGGAAKYLGIGSASAAAATNPAPSVPDASLSTAEEANFFASNDDDDDDDDDDDEDDVDTHDTHCRYDASEASASRRWSCAMRVAYALGDAGAPLLERAFFDDETSARNDMEMPRRSVRVLCLDGGGIRGLATIVMLARIMRAAGAWCVGECFDLIVGTSTGGVIALGAGLLRLTLDEVGDLYDAMASEVFKPDGYYDLLRRGPGHAAAKAFERVMSDMLGPEANQPLYAAAAHPRWYAAGARDEDEDIPRVDDDETSDASQKCRRPVPPRVCLVSSLVSRQPSTLVLLRSYHRGGGERADASADGRQKRAGDLPGEHRMGAVDALRATTAAPWYMEELALEKELSLGRLRLARAEEEDDGGSSSVDVPNGVDDAFVINEPVTRCASSSTGGSEKTKRDDCDAHGVLENPGEAFHEDGVFASHVSSSLRVRRGKGAEAVTSARDASRVESSLRFIDGAIACNNPTSVGIFEARRLFGRNRPLCVVSLGTGAAVPCETKTRAQDIGNVMGNLVNATCDVLQVDALARSLLPGERDRYFRFQPVDDVFGCELNDSSEATRRALREAARRYMDTDAVVHETRALAEALRE